MIKIRRFVIDSIIESTPFPPPETGGILGLKEDVICHYYPDFGMKNERGDHYSPSTKALNLTISEWNTHDIVFCGIYHSHFEGDVCLSKGDLKYINNILFHVNHFTDSLLFPLVFPKKEMIFYKAFLRNDRVEVIRENIHVV